MTDAYSTAMALLSADRPSREDVERAGQLLEAASGEGHAEASERCALFEAFGMARQQSWDRGLDFLALSARQGSQTSKEQLLLLSDNSSDPVVPEDADDAYWQSVRSRIDVAGLIQPGKKSALSETPRIRLIEGFATHAECRWLVAMARGRLRPATVFDSATGQQTYDAARDNRYMVLGIRQMNVVTEIIRQRIAAATGLPVPLFEPSQLLQYSVGEQFKPHCDFLEPSNPTYAQDIARFGQRIATFLIYLNDAYSGGETEFLSIGLKCRAKTGDALFWANVTRDGAPDPSTLHAGLPPTSGEKWVFSQWIRDRFPGA